MSVVGGTTILADNTDDIRIRIDEQWYDVTAYSKAHPGGELFLQLMNGRDATAVFYAIHSNGANGSSTAIDRLSKMKKCDAPEADRQRLPDAAAAAACDSFQQFRKSVEADGWFEREAIHEARLLAQTLGLYAAGQLAANAGHPIAAGLLLGLGMEQAGWLAHDYVHGRGRWCSFMRSFGCWTNGFSGEWWGNKHNMHHAFTNIDGYDDDIASEPFLYLRPPSETGREDSPMRPFQHIYGYPLYAVTFLLWRMDSLLYVWERRNEDNKYKVELAALMAQYFWLFFCLPPSVAISSVLLGGFLCGSIVTATHQSEEISEIGKDHDYAEQQFRTTRDAQCGPWWETALWGGMDTQLEHHLFPTMPRYKLHKFRPLLKAFADSHPNDFDYKISTTKEIIDENIGLLKRVGQA